MFVMKKSYICNESVADKPALHHELWEVGYFGRQDLDTASLLRVASDSFPKDADSTLALTCVMFSQADSKPDKKRCLQSGPTQFRLKCCYPKKSTECCL